VSANVERRLDERELQGLPRHVEDESVLDAVAHLMANATNAGNDARRSSRTGDVTSDASRG
jgi:hypothetical protein